MRTQHVSNPQPLRQCDVGVVVVVRLHVAHVHVHHSPGIQCCILHPSPVHDADLHICTMCVVVVRQGYRVKVSFISLINRASKLTHVHIPDIVRHAIAISLTYDGSAIGRHTRIVCCVSM